MTHFDAFPQSQDTRDVESDLAAEFRAWDMASDEALEEFEKELDALE